MEFVGGRCVKLPLHWLLQLVLAQEARERRAAGGMSEIVHLQEQSETNARIESHGDDRMTPFLDCRLCVHTGSLLVVAVMSSEWPSSLLSSSLDCRLLSLG